MAQDSTASGLSGGADDLLAELRHATGNLLHRMRHWTALLEGEALGVTGAEALTELRASLDGLQQLIAETTDALRPVEVRRAPVSVADVVCAIALRFGTKGRDDSASVASATWNACVLVDPALLDRALALLVDALSPIERFTEAAKLSVAIAPAAAYANPVGGLPMSIAVAVHATRHVHDGSESHPKWHEDISLALARKLLAETECRLTCSSRDDRTTLEFRFPLDACF